MSSQCLNVTTESGTVYTLVGTHRVKRDGARLISADAGGYVRRTGGGPMRGDGAWVRLLACDLAVGQPMRMILDLIETPEGVETLRMTSPVVSIVVGEVEDAPCV